MPIQFTLFKRPNGASEEITMTKIDDEDAQWFTDNNVTISGEDCGSFFCFWFDYGAKDEDGEPDEYIHTIPVNSHKTCNEHMHEVRLILQKRKE